MTSFRLFLVLFFFILAEKYSQGAPSAPESIFRQKRCIVIQKQSGTHGDSTEDGGDDDDDDEYRKPQAKNPHPYKRRDDRRDIGDQRAEVEELAEFEGVPDGPELSPADLIADGFDASPAWFFVLIAERAGKPLGHALVNRAYSSWTRRAYYVEDLYVQAEDRRSGVGSAILQRLCEMAVAEGVTRIDWHVLRDNAAAIRFYTRLGARDLCASEGRTALRLDAPRIAAVAKGDFQTTNKTD